MLFHPFKINLKYKKICYTIVILASKTLKINLHQSNRIDFIRNRVLRITLKLTLKDSMKKNRKCKNAMNNHGV